MEANRRSDQVRARRNQRSTSPKARSPRKDDKSKKSRSKSMPPMVSRSGMVYTAALPPKARKKNRRQYNVAIDATGAEVKLPAMPALSIGWRVLSGLIVAGMLFGLYWLWTTPLFTVENVTLNGLGRVDQGELLAKANVIGKPVFVIDTVSLEQDLQTSIRALENLTVTVSFPAAVSFEAEERQPVIVWEQAGVTSWWVDINGVRFAPLGSSDGLIYVEAKAPPPPIPVPQAVQEEQAGPSSRPGDNQQLLPPEMVSAILFLSDYLPEGANLMFNEKHGIGWEDSENGWRVFFGKKLDQMPVRIALYQAVVEDFEARNIHPVLISIEQVRAPYYRMRN
ncbi:MAG: hypothetical protein ABFS17_01445 [Chloroflexota bacterium]